MTSPPKMTSITVRSSGSKRSSTVRPMRNGSTPYRLANSDTVAVFVTRRVTKTATVSLFANRYGVEPFLIGRTVELRFDPEDLTVIDVIFGGEVICQAVPYSIGRHVHPAVPQAIPPRQEQDGPGIDYLGLVRLAEEQAIP